MSYVVDLDRKENAWKMYEKIKRTNECAAEMLMRCLKEERLYEAFENHEEIPDLKYIKLHEVILHWYEKICEAKGDFPERRNYTF